MSKIINFENHGLKKLPFVDDHEDCGDFNENGVMYDRPAPLPQIFQKSHMYALNGVLSSGRTAIQQEHDDALLSQAQNIHGLICNLLEDLSSTSDIGSRSAERGIKMLVDLNKSYCATLRAYWSR